MPPSLLEQSRETLRATFSAIVKKRIYTLNYDRSSDMTWATVHKLRAAGKSHPRLVGAKAESPTFAIVHYAGEVQYSSVGFLHKNKDPLSEDLQVLTRGSTEPLIAELFDASQQPSARRRAGFRGVVIQFVADLAQLLKVRVTDGP